MTFISCSFVKPFLASILLSNLAVVAHAESKANAKIIDRFDIFFIIMMQNPPILEANKLARFQQEKY
ncbi:hypothetical protein ACEWX4_07670 [Acinetobacter indicus]|uniref:hypothetical protein n=1 Tax=Acinetobacter indicus TaxID=756892 RepID=UPI0035BC44A9